MNAWLYKLVVFLSKLHSALFPNQHLHLSRFARIDELESIISQRLDGSSLLLGTYRFNHILRVRETPARRELGNVLIAAPTRGGKGLLATSQLLTWQHSVIVNDIKGELFQQTAGYRKTLGNVFVIDPHGYGHRYDPLQGKQTEDELYSSATHLLFQADEGEDVVFTQRATNMLTQIFLAARLENQPPLPYVRQVLRTGLQQAAERLEAIKPELATQFLDVNFAEANFTDRFLLSAWGVLTARMRPLLTETVVKCFTGSDFAPRDLLFSDTPITIYLRWPERDLLALSPLVRLLWGSFIDELITSFDTVEGKHCKPVLLLIDEAGRTAIPSLADHATTVVGRGITLWIAIQSLAQLEAVYGKTRAKILLDNVETQLYYRPANQETAEYLERCLGKKSDYATSHHLRDGEETSQGLSEQGIPLLTAWEIKQLQDEEIIGFHRRLPPFKAKRMDWRQSKLLTNRRHMPVDTLPVLPELTEIKQSNGHSREAQTMVYIDADKIEHD